LQYNQRLAPASSVAQAPRIPSER